MKYFTFKELVKSNVAESKDIDNIPDWESIGHLATLVINVLDPLRELYGKPIRVTSGYRSEALNKAVNGVKTSHHIHGYAADIVAGAVEDNKKLFELLISSDLQWTQAILEEGGEWIHVSYISDNLKKQILYT